MDECFYSLQKKVMAQKVVNKRYNYPCMKAQWDTVGSGYSVVVYGVFYDCKLLKLVISNHMTRKLAKRINWK